jgi:Ni/Co efflux regulator RcnB
MTMVTEQVVVMTARAAAARRSATTIATTITTATMATMTSHSRLLTANQGDADDREENRDAQNQRTIHPQSSNKRYRNLGPKVRPNTKRRSRGSLPPIRERRRMWRKLSRGLTPSKIFVTGRTLDIHA